MITPKSPLPSRPYVVLPPVSIEGRALFLFSQRINRQLRGLERRFGADKAVGVPSARKAWIPLPKKPK